MFTFAKICNFAILVIMLGLLSDQSLAEIQGLKETKILAGWQNNNGSHTSAVEIRMETGWKTYWHAPGSSGIPPRFSFEGSENLRNFEFKWPSPVLFGDDKLWSVGYKNKLVLPMIIIPKDKNKPIKLNLHVEIGICDIVCVPAEFSMHATLHPKRTKPNAKIVAALASRPKSKTAVDAKELVCAFSMSDQGMLVTVDLYVPKLGAREVIMLNYADSDFWIQNKMAKRLGNMLSGSGIIRHSSGTLTAIEKSKVAVNVISEKTAADLGTCAQ